MYAIWVWKRKAVISDMPWSYLKAQVHPNAKCMGSFNTKKGAEAYCRFCSWTVVAYSHYDEGEAS